MPNYTLIKNKELRELVMKSESIQSQSPEATAEMVRKIAGLPKEGQKAFIKALKDEREQVLRAKEALGITPESELKEIEDKSIKLQGIKSKFGRTARYASEKVSRDVDEEKAEALLNEINEP